MLDTGATTDPEVTIKTIGNRCANWVILARMFVVPVVAPADTLKNSPTELPAVSVVAKADIFSELPTTLLEQTA